MQVVVVLGQAPIESLVNPKSRFTPRNGCSTFARTDALRDSAAQCSRYMRSTVSKNCSRRDTRHNTRHNTTQTNENISDSPAEVSARCTPNPDEILLRAQLIGIRGASDSGETQGDEEG